MSSATPLSTLDVSTTTPAHLNWILNQLTEIRYDGWKIPTYKLTVQQRLDQQQHQNEEEIETSKKPKSTNENTNDNNKAKAKTEVEEVEETAPAPPLPIQPGTTLEAHRVTEFLCSRIIAHSPALESRRESLEQIFSTTAAKNLISNTFWLLFLEFFALTDGVARVMAYRHVVGGLMDELHGTCDDRESNMALTNPAQIQILENALRSGVQPGNALTHGFLSSCGFVTMDVSGVHTSGSGANSTKATTAKNVSQVPMPHHLTPRILDNVEDFDWGNYHRRKLLYGGADGETDHTSSNYDSDDEEGHSRHSKQQRSTSRSTNGNKKEHGRSSSRASSKNARKNHETRRELCEEEARRKFLRGRSKSVMEDSPEVMLQMLNYKQQATKETSKIVISGLERVQTRVGNDGINEKNYQQPGAMRRTLSGRQLIIRAPGASISKENEKAALCSDDDDDENASDSDNIDERNPAQKKLFGSFNTSRPKSTETTTTTTSKTSKPRSNHNRQRKSRPRSTSTTGSTTSGPSGRTSPSSASGASSSRSVMTATMITSRKSPRKKVRCTSRASSLFLGEHQNASVTPGTIMSLVLTIGNSVDSTSSGENNNNNDKNNSASAWKKSAASVLPGSIASAAHSAVFGMTRAVLEEIVRTKMQDSQFKPYSGRTEATAALRLLRDSGILEKVQCRRLLLDKFITSVDAESISKKRGVVLAAMEAVAEEQNKIFTHMSFNFVAVMQKLAPRGHVSSFSVPRDMVLPFLSDALAQTFCALIFDCFPYLRGEMKLETRRAAKRHASFWFDGVDKDEVGHWGFHFVRPKLMLRDGAEQTTLNGIKVGQSEQNILADVGTHRNSRRKHGRKYSPTNSNNNTNNNLSTSRVESPLQGSLSPARSTSPISPSTKYFMAKADMRHNSVNNNNNNFLLQHHQTPVKPSTSQSQLRPFGVSSTARAGASSNQNRRGKISPINRPRSRQQRPHTTIAFAAALSPGASIPSNSMMMAMNQNMRRRTNSISGGSTGMNNNNNNNNNNSQHQHQNGGNTDTSSNTVIPFFAGVTSIPGPRNARAELTKLFSSIEDEQRQERHEKREEQRLREIETARLRHAREMQMSAIEKSERANRKKFGSKSSHPVAGFGDDKASFRPGLVSSTSAFMASAVSIHNNNNNNASTTSPKQILAPLVINPSSGAPGKSGLIPSPPSFSKNSNFNASELYAQIDTTLNKNKNENGVTSPASANTYKLPSTMISSRSATNTKVIGENYFGVNNNNNNNNNTPQNQSPKQPSQFPLPSDDPNQNSIFFVVPPALLVNGVPIQSFNNNNNRGNAEQDKPQQPQNNANNNLNSATQTLKPENAPDGDLSISQSQAQNLMTASTSQILVPSPPPLKQKATRVPSSLPLGKKKISFVQSSNFPPSTNYGKSNNNHNNTANDSQSNEKGIIEVINSSSFLGSSNIAFINSNADSNGDDASRISHRFGPSKSSLGSRSVTNSKQLDRSAKETETRGRPQVSKPDKQFSVRDFSRQRARHQQRALELKKAEAIANNHRFAPSRQPDAHWHRYGASRRPPPSATMAMTTGDDFFAEGEFHIGLLSPIMERFCEEQNMRSARDVTLKYPSKMQWSFLVKMHGNSMYGEKFGKNANNNKKEEE